MRESDRLGSLWVREGGRLKKRDREGGVKQMCQNCIPTMNMNTLCLIQNLPPMAFFDFMLVELFRTVKRSVTDSARQLFVI